MLAWTNAPAVRTRRVRAGEFIIRQGDPRPQLLLLCQGLCIITRLTESGEEAVLQTCGRAGIVDLSGWLQGAEAYSVSARALVDSTVAAVTAETFVHLVSKDARWVQALLRQIGAQMQVAEERLRWQAAQDATSRVLHGLLELLGELGLKAKKNIVVPIPLSLTVFAQILGLRRETLSRTLAHLQRQGVVIQGKGQMTIPDLSRVASTLDRCVEQYTPRQSRN